MTKERKIEILKDLLVQLSDSANILCTCDADERCEVVEECIKSLEQQPSDDYCVSRQAVLDILSHYAHNFGADNEIKSLPPVKPTHGTCKDCKYWKDSDGVYRRGVGAESKCPINIKEVYEGNFYCKDFEKAR